MGLELFSVISVSGSPCGSLSLSMKTERNIYRSLEISWQEGSVRAPAPVDGEADRCVR